jgi:hypothetical protein
MRKTLLIAAAALAGSIISSQAQVYSQNVVGYANVPTPNAGGNYLISVPFTIGVSNGANEVFGTSLPNYTQVLVWNVSSASYTIYQSDSTSPTGWDDGGFSPIAPPVLPVGQGFFLIPSASNVTNTFAGAVAVSVGTSNVTTFASAGANYLVGETVPYAGSITNGANSGGGVNLNGLANYTQLLIWNVTAASYTIYQTDSSSPTGWDDGGFSPIAPPSISVGQGFFIIPSANNETWTQGL